jgi:hypothetical protein
MPRSWPFHNGLEWRAASCTTCQEVKNWIQECWLELKSEIKKGKRERIGVRLSVIQWLSEKNKKSQHQRNAN